MSDQQSPSNDALPLSMLALESMPFPMNIYGPDGVVFAANSGVEQLFKVPREYSVNVYNLFEDPVTEANGFRAAFERARAGETVTLPPNLFDPARYELPGEAVWFTTSVFPFASPDGAVRFVGGVCQDVTAQVRAEAESARLTAELAERAREFQPFYALAENAPDGFMLTSLDLRITYINRAFRALIGFDEDVQHLSFATFLADMGAMEGVGDAMAAAGVWQGELDYRHANGHIVPVQCSILLIRDVDGQPQSAAAIIRDLSTQRQAEEERTALQEQVIESQQAALRELSTPLIPLTESVVVMPLVGTIDSRRAQQIMEALLEGIAAYQAEVVLLDISGVRVVDTQVADALLRTAKAVKLLGGQVVLTGISAEIAQTIVHLGADMGQIVTQANLQAGLRYAMARYGDVGWAGAGRKS